MLDLSDPARCTKSISTRRAISRSRLLRAETIHLSEAKGSAYPFAPPSGKRESAARKIPCKSCSYFIKPARIQRQRRMRSRAPSLPAPSFFYFPMQPTPSRLLPAAARPVNANFPSHLFELQTFRPSLAVPALCSLFALAPRPKHPRDPPSPPSGSLHPFPAPSGLFGRGLSDLFRASG